MSILQSTKDWFTSISVNVKDNVVIVDGLPSDFIIKDLYRIWRTSRIAEHMFNSMGRNRVTFDNFFLPDFYYALKRILGGKYMRCNRRVVEQLIFLIEDHTWIKNLEKEYPSILNYDKLKNLNLTPKDHQSEYFKFFDQQVQRMGLKGFLLSAAPGTGKTVMAMAINEMLETKVNIYIVPNNSVYEVWDVSHRDILKNSAGNYWTSRQNKPLVPGLKAYIFHYEALDQAVDFFTRYPVDKASVTLDECHNFNTPNSQRTMLFVTLCKIVKPINILWMSGTPIKALGSEVIPLLRTIDPLFNSAVEERFKNIFGMSSTAGLDILSHRLGLISYKIEKAGILQHKVLNFRVDVRLPNGNDYTLETIRNRMTAYITERMKYYEDNMPKYVAQYEHGLKAYEKVMDFGDKKDYEKYRKSAQIIRESYDPVLHKDIVIFCNQFENKVILPALKGSVREDFKNARSVYKYYYLKVQGEALGRILGRARTMCNIDIAVNIKEAVLTDLQTNERSFVSLPDIINSAIKKTLLYTDYVEVVDKVCTHLEKEGYKTLKVYGDTNKDLKSIIKTFTDSKKYNPLVATFKSLSTAVPMIMANTIVMLNTPFRDHDYIQAVSRCDRMGQDEDVYIYVVYLDTGKEPNISTRSKDIMDWSKEMVDAIMGRKVSNTDVALESYEESASLDLDQVARQVVKRQIPTWTNL